MIFYFSGTGNSLDIAKRIADRLGEKRMIAVANYTGKPSADSAPISFPVEKYERIGFVFPVYAWGPPKPVLDFNGRLSLENKEENYFYAVATCGGSIGNTMGLLNKHLKRVGCALDSAFSIVMPNNYIITGDVNTKEEEQILLIESEVTLRSIIQRLEIREKDIFILDKGPAPGLMTALIHPAFNMQPNKARSFYATDDCTRCGICAEVCNCGNIEIKDVPVWGDRCVQCLACLHYCPVQYGKATLRKGRYVNPNVPRNRLSGGKP